MSWGDSFISGFNAVSDARLRKSKQAQDDRLAAADQQLKRDLMQKQIDADAAKLRESFNQNSQLMDKDHSWKTGERLGSESFTGGQNKARMELEADLAAKNRGLTQQQLDQGKQRNDDQLRMDMARMQLEQKRTDMQEPLLSAQADYYKAGGPRTAGPSTTETFTPDGELLSKTVRTPGGYGTAAPAAPAASSPAASPAFGAEYEGRTLKGPDGKRYKVVNGTLQPL